MCAYLCMYVHNVFSKKILRSIESFKERYNLKPFNCIKCFFLKKEIFLKIEGINLLKNLNSIVELAGVALQYADLESADSGWFGSGPSGLSETKRNLKSDFEEYMNDDSTHTKMINSIHWKIHKFNHWNYWKNMFQKFNLD